MPKPRSTKPYVNGPYEVVGHGKRWRLHIFPGDRVRTRGGGLRRRILRPSFETREAALVFRREYLRQTASGGRTVGDAVIEYTQHLTRKGNKPDSVATARYRLAALDASLAIADLSPARAQAWYEELVDQSTSVDTQRGTLVSAKALGTFLVKKKWSKANPFEDIEPLGRKSEGKEQLRIDESRKFFMHCMRAWNEQHDRSAIAALAPLMMSLRANEVAQLMAIDVDDDARILWIAEHQRKTQASRRRAMIPKVMRDAFRALAAAPATPEGHLFGMGTELAIDTAWRAAAIAARKARGLSQLELAEVVGASQGAIWQLEHGSTATGRSLVPRLARELKLPLPPALGDPRPATRHWVSRHVQRHMTDAGVRVLTTHSLRGLHATLARIEGQTGEAVARALGHENEAITNAAYIDHDAVAEAELGRFESALFPDGGDVADPGQTSPIADESRAIEPASAVEGAPEGDDHGDDS